MTPEQRPSERASGHSTVNAEEGGMPMKATNNTDAPQLHINWKHVLLVGLHVVALVLSIATHKLWTKEAPPRALP